MQSTAVLLGAVLAVASWGGGSCEPVGLASTPSLNGWVQGPPGFQYLYRGGQPARAWHAETGDYWTWDGRQWVAEAPVAKRAGPCHDGPCACDPCRCLDGGVPCDSCLVPGAVRNFGVDMSKLGGKDKPKYHLNGNPVSREAAVDAIENGIPDDSGKLRLTAIGGKSETEQVAKDITGPEFADLKDRLVFKAYEPSHWAVAQSGFVTTGKPTIYLQAPDGKVIHRQDDYADGAPGLVKAIRKADPNYKPEKDRDLRKPTLFPGLPPMPSWAWALIALVASLFFPKR